MWFKSIKNQAEQFLNGYKTDNPATFAAAQQAIGGLLILDGVIGIDNPLGGTRRSGIFGSLMGIALGLVFVLSGNFMSNVFGLNSMSATTTATVTSVNQPSSSSSDSSCTLQAAYTVAGKEYTQTSSSSSSSACGLTVGQTITINYDPNSPGKWAYDVGTLKALLNIFPIVGAIVALISLVTFVIRLLSIIFGWKLLRSGRALAKTLPAGTDLSTIKNEIRQNFAKSIFGMGGVAQPMVATTAPTQPQQSPVQPQVVAQPPAPAQPPILMPTEQHTPTPAPTQSPTEPPTQINQ